MLFSELYKIMVNKVTLIAIMGGDRPNRPLDPPLVMIGYLSPFASPNTKCFKRSPSLLTETTYISSKNV